MEDLIVKSPEQVTKNQTQIKLMNNTPWLKYALVALVVFILINIGLYFLYVRRSGEGILDDSDLPRDESGFFLTKPGQSISREGYTINFTDPRYEHTEVQSFFRVDVTLTNVSFEPTIKVLANCDIEEGDSVVKTGAGVSIESGEARPVLPGASSTWTAVVLLDNRNQEISSCIYAPEGVFDPNQTIRVVF